MSKIKVYRFLSNLPSFSCPVLTIGTFDGVHLGHQKIIKRIREIADEQEGETLLLTFHPHPKFVLHPDDYNLKLINTLDERIELLEQYGIDNLLIGSFTDEFSQLEPENYLHNFIMEKIKPTNIVIGFDHRFGKGRKGDIGLMKKMAPELDYKIEEIPVEQINDIKISSTKIREAIAAGNIQEANKLSGHPFTLSGQVITGNQVGIQIGFPTANIFVENKRKLIPGIGIYAVFVHYRGKRYKGMLYIGFRPTFSGTEKTIEVNIFDLNANLYGETLGIDFIAKTRDDVRFNSREALVKQLEQDKIDTLAVLDQG